MDLPIGDDACIALEKFIRLHEYSVHIQRALAYATSDSTYMQGVVESMVKAREMAVAIVGRGLSGMDWGDVRETISNVTRGVVPYRNQANRSKRHWRHELDRVERDLLIAEADVYRCITERYT